MNRLGNVHMLFPKIHRNHPCYGESDPMTYDELKDIPKEFVYVGPNRQCYDKRGLVNWVQYKHDNDEYKTWPLSNERMTNEEVNDIIPGMRQKGIYNPLEDAQFMAQQQPQPLSARARRLQERQQRALQQRERAAALQYINERDWARDTYQIHEEVPENLRRQAIFGNEYDNPELWNTAPLPPIIREYRNDLRDRGIPTPVWDQIETENEAQAELNNMVGLGFKRKLSSSTTSTGTVVDDDGTIPDDYASPMPKMRRIRSPPSSYESVKTLRWSPGDSPPGVISYVPPRGRERKERELMALHDYTVGSGLVTKGKKEKARNTMRQLLREIKGGAIEEVPFDEYMHQTRQFQWRKLGDEDAHHTRTSIRDFIEKWYKKVPAKTKKKYDRDQILGVFKMRIFKEFNKRMTNNGPTEEINALMALIDTLRNDSEYKQIPEIEEGKEKEPVPVPVASPKKASPKKAFDLDEWKVKYGNVFEKGARKRMFNPFEEEEVLEFPDH